MDTDVIAISLPEETMKVLRARVVSEGRSLRLIVADLVLRGLEHVIRCDPLAGYRDWLIEIRGYKPSSASTIVSQLKLALREIGPQLTAESLAEWCESPDKKAYRATRRVAHRRYQEWQESRVAPSD